MKRFLIIITAMFLSLALIACKDKGKTTEPNKTPQNDVQVEAPKEEQKTTFTKNSEEIRTYATNAAKVLEQIPIYAEGYPTVDDVVLHYKNACMAIGWIVGTEKVATDSADTYEYDGLIYQRVRPDCYYGIDMLTDGKALKETIGLIYNLETLEKYFATLLGKEDAAEYIYDISNSFEVEKFIEDENGALYALPYGFAAPGYTDEESYVLTDNGDGTYTFTVTYGTTDGEVYSEDFGYEKVDGRWVLTGFYVVKQN